MSVEINVTDQIIEVTPTDTQIDVNITETPVLVDVTDQIIEITETGLQGPQGPAGPGVPTGGTAGQILAKNSSTNYDTLWIDNNLSDYVPYIGATQNVDLGEFELKAGQLTLDTSPTGIASVGTTRWNNTIGSTETTLKGGNVILKNGVDLVARIVNKVTPNQTLTKADYKAVRISGAQGQRLAVELARANNDTNSADTIGIVTETIPTNQEGFIITVGQLEEINTTGSLQGETWVDGDVLYLSPTIAGALTNVKPNGSTGHIVVIGYVEYAHAVHGKIYVKVMNGWELDELHNVYINNPLNNEGLFYNSSTQLWGNKSIATVLGYTPANQSTTLTINGTTYDISANRSWTIPTHDAVTIGTANGLSLVGQILSLGLASSSTNGALNSTDWNTFNNKQNALTLTTTGTSGPATLIGNTLNIPQYEAEGNYVTTATTLTINGTTYDLSANRSWSVGTVTSVDASGGTGISVSGGPVTGSGTLTITNTAPDQVVSLTGTGTTSITGTYPNFTINSADQFTGTVTSIATSAPLTGGTITNSGTIGITQATTSTDGYLSSTDWNTFNNKQNALTNPVTGTGTTNYLSKFTGASTIGDSIIFDNGSGVGIGTTSLTGYDLRVSSNITGSTIGSGVAVDGIIQSIVTNQARLFVTTASTQAATFTLGTLYHYAAFQGTFGAGSTVGIQYGYFVSSGLTGATTNYGFYSNLAASGTARWNMYMNGTAPNYMAGSLGIGNTGNLGFVNLAIQKTITGNVVGVGVSVFGTVQSDVTTRAEYFGTSASTQATTFTLSNLIHYRADQGTFGAGSTVTNQAGFQATATLIGATNNYGFRGTIASGTGRWNIFMDGTAANHLSGNTIIGGTTDAGFKFDVQGTTRLQGTTTISGSTTAASAIARGVNITPTLVAAANNDVLVGVDITPTFTNGAFTGVENTALRVSGSILSRAANPLFIMRDTDLDTNALYLGADFGFASGLISYGSFAINRNPANGVFFNTGRAAAQINLESQVSNSGIVLLTSTTNNTTPTERIRVFGNGNVGIGVGGTDAGFKLDVVGTARFIPSTNQSIQVHTQTISGQATYTAISGGTVTLPSTTGYGLYISQNGNQAGLNAGQGVWLGVGGANHFNVRITTGNIIIQNGGTFTDIASARLQVNSTTQGFLPPRMTTTQKNAIATPVAGLMVYDTTLNKLCVYTTAWETITSA